MTEDTRMGVSNLPEQYLSEILEQPDAVRTVVQRLAHDKLMRSLGESYQHRPGRLVFIGMGSSHYAAVAVRHRLSQARIPFVVCEAGEFLHYETGIVAPSDWVVRHVALLRGRTPGMIRKMDKVTRVE